MRPLDVQDALETRRALRTFGELEVTDKLVDELAGAASLAPSCNNNQPWRYVFVSGGGALEGVKDALTRGNAWARKAPLFIVVFSRPELDCVLSDGRRVYNWFDTGLATGNLLLRATELGLATHPIAGFDPDKVKEATGIPDDMTVLAIIVAGRKLDAVDPELNDKQIAHEMNRPARLPVGRIAFRDRYVPPADGE